MAAKKKAPGKSRKKASAKNAGGRKKSSAKKAGGKKKSTRKKSRTTKPAGIRAFRRVEGHVFFWCSLSVIIGTFLLLGARPADAPPVPAVPFLPLALLRSLGT